MWGVNLSSKALMGWGGHSGYRVAFTESWNGNDGYTMKNRSIKSEYDSIYGVVGGALTKSYLITHKPQPTSVTA
jgi:hypothetical protein